MGSRVWLEISLLEYWGPKPHGIPRVSQNVFLQSLKRDGIGYFLYDRAQRRFVVPTSNAYFLDLAAGRVRYNERQLPDGPPLDQCLGPDDRVLFSEAGWDHANYLGEVQALRRQFPSAVLQFLLCDLLPIKCPHFFESDFGERAASFMHALPSFCDRYVCISKSTAADVRQILLSTADARVFQLGSDVVDESAVSTLVHREPMPFVLSVGTIEVRKNHILLYFVWRHLSEVLGQRCPKLILVGREGWIAGDVYRLFTTDPAVKHLVEIRHEVTNEQLVALIRACQFTVFPSFYEGWGLPVSESLFYGKVCVTSNTSSLPEINPFPELMFDPYNHQWAFDIIRSLIENPGRLAKFEAQISSKFRRHTWEESFDELLKIIEM